jgi:hypothetical protein
MRLVPVNRSPLWSSGQSSRLRIHSSQIPFQVLQDFLSSSEPGTGYTEPCENNSGAKKKKKNLRGPWSASELYRLSDRHLSTKFSANFCG